MSIHEELPDTVRQSVLTSVARDRPISDDLIANTLNSLGTKVKSFYRYGRDEFHHGLPEGTLELKHANASTMNNILANIEGIPVVLNFMIFGKADPTYFAYEHLKSLGWDSITNIVSGTRELDSTEWIDNTTIRIYYDDEGTPSQEDITVISTNYKANYYHVEYELNDGEVKYFYYEATDPTYEVLQVTSTEKESQYFPVVPFIRDNVDLSVENIGDPLYDTSVRLCRKIGVNFKSVGESIQENPDVDQVDHAYMVIVAPIQSEHTATQEYLYNYFFHLAQIQVVNKGDYDSWNSLDSFNTVLPPINKIVINETENDADGEGNYHVEVGFNYIEVDTVVGTIGDVGTIERSTVINPRGETDDYAYETSYMIWRKQLTTTTYQELRVVGLKHVNHVYGSKHIDTTLEDSLSEDNDDFNLPIHIGVLEGMTLLRQTDVMNDSIRLCFNSVEKVKLKWYQTSIFKAIVIIVAAVITVMFDPSGQTMQWATAIVGASAPFILQVLAVAIINAAVAQGISLLVDVLGLENAAIMQIIYTVYQLSQGDFSEFSAELALQLQSGITQAANFYIKSESHAIMNEYDEMIAEQEEQQAELDELIEAFPTSTLLDPLSVLDSSTSLQNQFETPESYYNARIHAGNVGVLAFSEVQYYVEQKLQLEGVTDRNALNIL